MLQIKTMEKLKFSDFFEYYMKKKSRTSEKFENLGTFSYFCGFGTVSIRKSAKKLQNEILDVQKTRRYGQERAFTNLRNPEKNLSILRMVCTSVRLPRP